MLHGSIERALVAGLLTAAVSLTASTALASGFAAARFGGEHGNPTETNPSTIYYNPAGIGLSTGTNLMLDLNVAFRSAQYDRPVGSIDDQEPFPDDPDKNQEALEANSGPATLDNTLLSPMAGVSTDFGMADFPLRVGVAFFAPFGGQAVWDENHDVDSDLFPGASDGTQRWYSIDGEITTLAVAGGAAYNIQPLRLSIGVAGNLYLSTVNTLRARNADGSDDLEAGGRLKEGRSLVDVSSTDWGLGGGVLWEAVKRKFWVGASYQSRPNLDGDMRYDGTLTNLLATSQERSETDVILTSSLPDIFRLGVRYRPMPELELRLFGDFTRWSALDQQCLVGADAPDIEASCETADDGSQVNESAENPIQVLQRNWEDAIGVRAGASWWLMPNLELLVGAGFDQNAVPDETLDAALMDMNKVTASLGTKYGFTDYLALMVTATNVFYFERDTTDIGDSDNSDFELPSRQPGNVGVYDQNIFLINTNLQLTF